MLTNKILVVKRFFGFCKRVSLEKRRLFQNKSCVVKNVKYYLPVPHSLPFLLFFREIAVLYNPKSMFFKTLVFRVK